MTYYIDYSNLIISKVDGDLRTDTCFESLDELMFNVVKNKKKLNHQVIMEERRSEDSSIFVQSDLNYLVLKYTRALGMM